MITKQTLLVGFCAIVGLSSLFAFLGIYNNNHMSFLLRTAFWASNLAAGSVVGLMFLPLLTSSPLKNLPVLLKILVVSLVAAIPAPFVIAAYANGYGNWPLEQWLTQYGLAVVIAIIVSLCLYMYLKSSGQHHLSEQTVLHSETPPIAFLERLPAKYHNAELYAVCSEDHYVQVHTSEGKEMILMRLSDALKELEQADGMQTHRSWWVARTGISESINTGRKYALRIKSGDIAPISRTFIKAAREAKFLV